MERPKYSYQNHVVQVSRMNFNSINAADETIISGFVTRLFLPINMKSGDQRGRKKVGVQISILSERGVETLME